MDSNSGQNGSSKGNTPQSKASSKSRRRTYSRDADVSSEDEEKKKLLASTSKIELQSLIGNRSNSKFMASWETIWSSFVTIHEC